MHERRLDRRARRSPRARWNWGGTLPWVFGLWAVLALPGCDQGSDPSGSGSATAKPLGACEFDSNGGNYRLKVASSPDPIPLNQPFAIDFTILPKTSLGSGKQNLTVEVDARMPAHFHGMTRSATLTRAPSGVYRAEGLLFHMPGRWELYIDISDGARTERAQMDIDLQ